MRFFYSIIFILISIWGSNQELSDSLKNIDTPTLLGLADANVGINNNISPIYKELENGDL